MNLFGKVCETHLLGIVTEVSIFDVVVVLDPTLITDFYSLDFSVSLLISWYYYRSRK